MRRRLHTPSPKIKCRPRHTSYHQSSLYLFSIVDLCILTDIQASFVSPPPPSPRLNPLHCNRHLRYRHSSSGGRQKSSSQENTLCTTSPRPLVALLFPDVCEKGLVLFRLKLQQYASQRAAAVAAHSISGFLCDPTIVMPSECSAL